MKLWGVYHANGGLIGEVAYVVDKLRGTAHCALCDVTHRVRMKQEWKAFAAALDVPFELVHLNEQSPQLMEISRERTPCVVEETRDGLRLVLGPEELEEAAGSVERFAELLSRARGGPLG